MLQPTTNHRAQRKPAVVPFLSFLSCGSVLAMSNNLLWKVVWHIINMANDWPSLANTGEELVLQWKGGGQQHCEGQYFLQFPPSAITPAIWKMLQSLRYSFFPIDIGRLNYHSLDVDMATTPYGQYWILLWNNEPNKLGVCSLNAEWRLVYSSIFSITSFITLQLRTIQVISNNVYMLSAWLASLNWPRNDSRYT